MLEALVPHIVETGTWSTQHPSCATWLRWLQEAEYRTAAPTANGGDVAVALFEGLGAIPALLEDVDALLWEPVNLAVSQPQALGDDQPWITAIK